jgi:hypothetical protein
MCFATRLWHDCGRYPLARASRHHFNVGREAYGLAK